MSDLLRYGEESRTGTKRTAEGIIRREDWGSLVGRHAQVWERNTERTGTISNFTRALFEVRNEDGEVGELSARDCLQALTPEQERLEWKWISLPEENESLHET